MGMVNRGPREAEQAISTCACLPQLCTYSARTYVHVQGAELYPWVRSQLAWQAVRVPRQPVLRRVPPCLFGHALGQVLHVDDATLEAQLICKMGEQGCALDRASLCPTVSSLQGTLEVMLYRAAPLLHRPGVSWFMAS